MSRRGLKTGIWPAIVLVGCLATLGCHRGEHSHSEASKSHAQGEHESTSGRSAHQKHGQHPTASKGQDETTAEKDGSTRASAVEALSEMDARKPVPLTPMMANHQKQNMRDHLVAIREIVAAAGKKDFEGVQKAASRIGSSPKMKKMCNHMGAGAEGFTERALEFHETADGIITSAKQEDMAGVMSSLDETLQTCTSCHATYKQKVVPPEVWRKKTGMSTTSGGMQHGSHGKHGGHR